MVKCGKSVVKVVAQITINIAIWWYTTVSKLCLKFSLDDNKVCHFYRNSVLLKCIYNHYSDHDKPDGNVPSYEQQIW